MIKVVIYYFQQYKLQLVIANPLRYFISKCIRITWWLHAPYYEIYYTSNHVWTVLQSPLPNISYKTLWALVGGCWRLPTSYTVHYIISNSSCNHQINDRKPCSPQLLRKIALNCRKSSSLQYICNRWLSKLPLFYFSNFGVLMRCYDLLPFSNFHNYTNIEA
jgi:hypothetical protein